MTNDTAFLAGIDAWNSGVDALVRRASGRLKRAEERASAEAERGDDEERPELSVAEAERRLRAAKELRAGWESVRAAAAAWPDALSWPEWADLVEEKLAAALGAAPDWTLFSTVLDELRSLGEVSARSSGGGSERVPRSRMVATLADALAALSYPEGRFGRDGVTILSVASARGLRFPLVIVPGLEEGKFPSRLRQDPLVLDRERRRIAPGRLPLKSERVEEEKLLFAMTVRAAEKRLVLVASRLDESSDRERIPSGFFLRAAAAARGAAVGYAELTAESVPGFRAVRLDRIAPPDADVAVDESEVRLRLVARDARALPALALEEPALVGGPLGFDRARWERQLTPFDGRITARDLRAWIAARVGPAAGPVSASRIEDYARCPYLFYLKRVVELEAWDEAAPALAWEPIERGRVVHDVLEAFLRECPGPGLRETPAEVLQERLRAAARERIEAARPPGIADLLWEIERDRLLEALERWLGFEIERSTQDLDPAFFERSFGRLPGAEDQPGPSVTAGRHRFEFRGRIDRIDVSLDRRRARVIDYKTGKLPASMSGDKGTALMAGEKIQIPIYKSALSVMSELAGVESIEGEYLHLEVNDGEIRARSFSKEELESAAARLPQMLEIVGDGIEDGVFFARSGGSVFEEHCKWCDFLRVCGKDRVRREERKAGDRAVERFGALAAIDGFEREQ
jgi:hypothetical protein